MNRKEIAKFLAGFAANQALIHGALASAGTQFTLYGIAYDQRLNTIGVVVWGVTFLLLIYYAWARR